MTLRTTIRLPAAASLLAYQFPWLIVETLNQGNFIAYAGWYTDSKAKGPVWHRWKRDERSRFGIALIVSIHALWSQGLLDIAVGEDGRAVRPGRATPTADLPPLERDVLAVVAQNPPMRPTTIVERLAVLRGHDFRANEAWFQVANSCEHDAPWRLSEALDLCKAMVRLEAGTDLEDEILRDQRGDHMVALEVEIFDALACR